jgi:vacuolar protein sorting-associated protein 29
VSNHQWFVRFFQGSITGAYTALTPDVVPSFVLLSVLGSKVVCYVYELIKGEVEVSKTEFSKESKQVRQLENLLA